MVESKFRGRLVVGYGGGGGMVISFYHGGSSYYSKEYRLVDFRRVWLGVTGGRSHNFLLIGVGGACRLRVYHRGGRLVCRVIVGRVSYRIKRIEFGISGISS